MLLLGRRKSPNLHFVSADPEMRRFDDLLFLLDFNIFSNVHRPVKHNWIIISFSANRFSLFALSFLARQMGKTQRFSDLKVLRPYRSAFGPPRIWTPLVDLFIYFWQVYEVQFPLLEYINFSTEIILTLHDLSQPF